VLVRELMEELAEMPSDLPVCGVFRTGQWSEVVSCRRLGREYPPNVYLILDLYGLHQYENHVIGSYFCEQIDDDGSVRS
jgi:hypothetical protein